MDLIAEDDISLKIMLSLLGHIKQTHVVVCVRLSSVPRSAEFYAGSGLRNKVKCVELWFAKSQVLVRG